MGVRKRRSTLTKASVSFVLRSLAILRTGISGWRMPIVNGSRAGLACANTSSSHRLRVSPRNASSSNSIEKVAWRLAAANLVQGRSFHPRWLLSRPQKEGDRPGNYD